MDTIRTVPVTLSNGSKLKIEATWLGGEEHVGDRFGQLDFGDVLSVVESFASDVGRLFTSVAPEKASVEFGVEVAIESGKLTTLLVKGSGKANLKITLEWKKAPALPGVSATDTKAG